MENLLLKLKNQALLDLENCRNEKDINDFRANYLGKKSELNALLRSLAALSDEERKSAGSLCNNLKTEINNLISLKLNTIKESNCCELDFDITLPGYELEEGSYHPITIVQREVEEIFKSMGFLIADTPEVESEYYNFEALNVPSYHPARDMQDTYWLDNGMVLRTQTSAGQVRMMENLKPPIKVIIPGKCFRNEEIDASHDNTFYQLEGMVIDKNISVANLLYTMEKMLSSVFNKPIKVRLRPGYFPFVEPGFELDIQCLICGGHGCSTCKQSGWIELLPCGMVHPKVLEYGGIDTKEYTGFAFGLGLTRLAMMKYNIPDIRVFNSGNLRILKQF
jgi:phenylalanyl-tRNA synthetase alpha chain